jgi:type I restriction enzyme S subunit
MSERVPFDHPWAEDVIGNKADVIVGGTPSTPVSRYWGGDVPWMASGDVHLRRVTDVPGRITAAGLRASAAKLVRSPAVAIALAGQGKTRGTVALTEIELCTNQSVALIKPQNDELNARYLYYALDFRYEELRARSAGGGRAGLTKQIVENIPIPLPPPDEQARIADILGTLDAAIDEAEATVRKLRKLKAGLLRDLLTQGVESNGRLRDPRRHRDLTLAEDLLTGRIRVTMQV